MTHSAIHPTIHHGSSCSDACCLQIRGLSVTMADQNLLQDVDIHIHCGQIVAIIGPNGAGKTTLFRAILGQIPHTGEIRFERAGGRRTRPLVGYVPQSPSFDSGDPVSVLDLFAASISRRPVFLPVSKTLRQKVLACLDRVHATELIDKRVGTLSGGELQRVLLAMALEPLPHVLLLDEPMSGVDIEGERQLMDMLDEIRSVFDLSILLSTHDFATLGQYADKVILLRQSVLKVGTAREVLTSPEFQSVFHLDLGGEVL